MENQKFCLVVAFIAFYYHIHQKLFIILGESLIQHHICLYQRHWYRALFQRKNWYKQRLIQTKTTWKPSSEGQSCLLDNNKPRCSHKYRKYSRKFQPNVKVSIGIQKYTSQGNKGKTPTLRTQAFIWMTDEIDSLRWIFDKVLIWLFIDWNDWYTQNAYPCGKKPALGEPANAQMANIFNLW